MKKIDIDKAEIRAGSRYPAPFNEPCMDKLRHRLGHAAGLTQFGVNRLALKPGVWASQRHWHARNDEFVYVLQGEVTLITNTGEEVLQAGDCAGFKAGDRDGHHLINRSGETAILLEIGSSFPDDEGEYNDIDMKFGPKGYAHKDGTPY